MSDPSPPLPSRPASPEAQAWHAHLRKVREEEPQRLEEAAKFLAGMISISLSLLLDINETGLAGKDYLPGIATGITLWLLSLLSAFLVLFPWGYRFVEGSAESIAQMHRRVVRVKRGFLIASTLLFTTALALLSLVYFLRLGSAAPPVP
jgi:hypothetical protein